MEKIFIYPREEDQTTSEIRKNRLISLEAQHGFLPSDYRNFLLSYGGGFPFPNDVEIKAPALEEIMGEDILAVFEFYSLDTIEGHLSGEIYGDATPQSYIFVGDAQGGFQILMSLQTQDFGAIVNWPHTSDISWGSSPNSQEFNNKNRLYPLAASFSALLAMMQELPGSEVARRNWELGPRRQEAQLIKI